MAVSAYAIAASLIVMSVCALLARVTHATWLELVAALAFLGFLVTAGARFTLREYALLVAGMMLTALCMLLADDWWRTIASGRSARRASPPG